jgi:hypothetical protein
MLKSMFRLTATLVCLLWVGATASATVVVTFPDVASANFNNSFVVWDSESFSIPNGQQIIEAQISGTWGISKTGNVVGTAPAELFLNGFNVSTDTSGLQELQPFNYVLSPTDLATLESTLAGGPGSYTATLSFEQLDCCEVVLGGVTLDIQVVTSIGSAVPELSTWAMMILGFAGIGFMVYRHNSKTALNVA